MKRVLAVINKSEDIKKVLEKSLQYLKDDSIFEVLYVHEEAILSLPDFFKPKFIKDDIIDKEEVKKRIKEVLKEFGYKRDTAIFVYVDDTADRVLELVEDDTFIVTAYEKEITKKVLKKIKNRTLILKNGVKPYIKVAIPIDLSKNSARCVASANELFEKKSLRVVYDFRYPVDLVMSDVDLMGMPAPDPSVYQELSEDLKKSQQERFYKFLSDEVVDGDFIVEEFDIEDDLKKYVEEKEIDLLYLCVDKNSDILDDSFALSLIDKVEIDLMLTRTDKGE